MVPEHDLESCPLAPEIQRCDRERGEISATLTSIKETLARLEPMIQAHEAAIQRQVGYQGLIGILSGMVGAVIGFIATRLFKS
jgi:hypothetical protein